jgi:hypothetical protein
VHAQNARLRGVEDRHRNSAWYAANGLNAASD